MHPTMLAYWSTEALTLIHGNPVVDGWAGAVMHKRLTSLAIFWTHRRWDQWTDQHGKV